MSRSKRATPPAQWVKFLAASRGTKIIRNEEPKQFFDMLSSMLAEELMKPGIG